MSTLIMSKVHFASGDILLKNRFIQPSIERFSIGRNCWSLQIVKLRLLSFQIWTFINLSLLSSYWPFTSSQTFIENLAHWKGGNKGRNILIPLSRKFHTNLNLAILKFKHFSNTPFWPGHTLGKYRIGLGLVKSKMKYIAKFTISLPCPCAVL